MSILDLRGIDDESSVSNRLPAYASLLQYVPSFGRRVDEFLYCGRVSVRPNEQSEEKLPTQVVYGNGIWCGTSLFGVVLLDVYVKYTWCKCNSGCAVAVLLISSGFLSSCSGNGYTCFSFCVYGGNTTVS